MTITADTEEDTLALAARMAGGAAGPLVVCLNGPLGAGKTTFVRGFLRGLGHKGAVPSPTFALIREYSRVKPRVYHLDLYRLGEEDVDNLGLEEYISDEKAVSLIEWPEAARPLLPRDRVEVELEHISAGRRLRLKAGGPRSKALLRLLG